MTAPIQNPWEASFPPSLRDYRIDLASLPANAAALATDAADRYQANTAFGFVLATGASTTRTFKDVDALSDAFARYLVHDMGLQMGQVIAVQLPTSLHYPIAVFGAWKAGLIVTNVNPMYTERELRLQLEDSGAQVLLASTCSFRWRNPSPRRWGSVS
jgi:long-chain acyl-CoA synthetase